MELVLTALFWIVVLGHTVFAAMQAFKWPFVAERLLKITGPETIEITKPVGTSFASYNFSIAIGFWLTLRLDDGVRQDVQAIILALIVFTAIVGFTGTKSKIILFGRLLPAALALLLLLFGMSDAS